MDTTFNVDAALASFLRSQKKRSRRGDAPNDIEVEADTTNESFGLLLLAGWQSPNQQQLCQPYERVCEIVRQCFEPEDFAVGEEDTVLPAAYLYPTEALHITVASFLPFTHPRAQQHQFNGSQGDVVAFWKDEILPLAESEISWPLGGKNGCGYIELELDKVQIGKSAGILMWKEVRGTVIADVRHCIRKACESYRERKEAEPADDARGDYLDAFAIPNITHTTFLRFPRPPSTSMAVVQQRLERLQQQLVGELKGIRIIVPFCMVRERVPYMHNMSCDDPKHVLSSFPI